MRQVIMVMLLGSILVLTMQCSENDPLAASMGHGNSVRPYHKVVPFRAVYL